MRPLTLALLLLVTGCDRGCLSKSDPARGSSSGSALDLTGTDCSDGMVRCKEGRIEASRAAHLPHPCGDPGTVEKRGSCTCPWDVIGHCRTGCAEEGLEVIATRDAGAQKVCRAETQVARPILPGDPFEATICSDEGVSCADGIVRACDEPGRPARAIALCLTGCDPGIAIDHGDPTNPDGVSMILCRRPHAERR